MNLNYKLEKFRDYCGDWDYRNIDMTLPHLQSIEITNNDISIEVEMYSIVLEDYVSVDGGNFSNENLVDKFKNLDLNCREEVWEFMNDIENLIELKKMDKKLYLEEKKQLKQEKLQNVMAHLINNRKDNCR